MQAPDPVLESIVDHAVTATAAGAGWLLSLDGDALTIVATGGAAARSLLGRSIASGSGTAGFVAASGQPLAMAPRRGDPAGSGDDGVAALAGIHPASVMAVPCEADGAIVGVLELVDKFGGGGFTFDDVEVVTLLAGVAGPALARRSTGPAPDVPEPEELAGMLARLANTDAVRYAHVATFVNALLERA